MTLMSRMIDSIGSSLVDEPGVCLHARPDVQGGPKFEIPVACPDYYCYSYCGGLGSCERVVRWPKLVHISYFK